MTVVWNKIKFFFKTLFANMHIVHEEQKWYFAIIFLLISMVVSVSGTLAGGYTANASSLTSTSSETAIDNALYQFGNTFLDTNNKITITDGQVHGEGVYTSIELNKEIAENNEVVENQKFTHTDSDGNEVTIFKVYVFESLEPAYSSTDSDILNAFLKKSVYKYTKEGDETSETAKWTPYSLLILTKNSVSAITYKVGAKSTDSAVGSMTAKLTDFTGTFSFTDIFVKDGKLNDSYISNYTDFLNTAYNSVKIPNAWMQTGIYFAINFAVTLLAGLVLWLVTRKKELIDGLHFNFWQSFKIAIFESLTPAILTAIASIFLSSYASFVFIIAISIRISSTISKLTNKGYSASNDTPVYKARS